MGLVVACVGGSGSLGEFGDDGVASSSVQTTSGGGSSSGRTTSSSGVTASSSGVTTSSSSGSTTSSSTSTSSTTSSGGSSGSSTFSCGTVTCSSTTQYCVKPCCDLSQQDCFAQDGGSCPSGYSFGFCQLDNGNGCVKNCTASQSTPYCTTSPSTTGLSGTCSLSSSTRTINCSCN